MDKDKKKLDTEQIKALIDIAGDSNCKLVISPEGQLSLEKKHSKKIRMY